MPESKKDEDKEVPGRDVVMISCVESTQPREYNFFRDSIWVFPNIGGFDPQMDGENNGKPYEQMDDLGVPLFSETSICCM